ncbi:adenosylcobinamide-GDP ribazoletransferase [Tropicimonas sediminicola]|uniref:Adenosylcobinamide-GDP ribazoletransferase n=1 Tax=Tropicimonas sediminicola TaxID=1031541 RepID=A0A239EPZ1_9RHOB|nr:adenosylcobinamide-GDP ribazoletransferase [Tropicimonas sediminicola]SNS46649.1 cobalamin-5'-phosphate synthase [Tropicimonas sediminicola]
MTIRPTPLADVALATALLTRLPVPVPAEHASTRGAAAAWAYPLAGLPVALAAGGLALGLMALGLPPAFAAGMALAVQVVLTGAMHEDGLADSADGLWGGWTRERRLEIMKDSRIGSYGVLALVLAIGLRWSLLAALGPLLLAPLLGAALLSRAAMTGVMAALPNARTDGLSRSIGRPGAGAAVLAMALALGLSLALLGPQALLLAALAGLASLACAALARAKLGGQTGDILGATQQVAEIVTLATAAALLA